MFTFAQVLNLEQPQATSFIQSVRGE